MTETNVSNDTLVEMGEDTAVADNDDLVLVRKMQQGREQMVEQIRRVIVGQDAVIEELLIALFAGGHVLVTGVPGLAKTLLIKTVADILQLDFSRIQFTPLDAFGCGGLGDRRGKRRASQAGVRQGADLHHILLADEINRTPPKTQSSLLEAMEERQVTAAGITHKMAQPFFVLATQNPIELEGTYPLPEAQLDRFMFKIELGYLSEEEEVQVVSNTTRVVDRSVSHPLSGEDILAFQRVARQVPAAQAVVQYAVRLVHATRPQSAVSPQFVKDWVTWGAGIRASQNLVLAGKVRALLQGRYNVSFNDIRALAPSVLRHRIQLNFHAEAERITSDELIRRVLETVAVPGA